MCGGCVTIATYEGSVVSSASTAPIKTNTDDTVSDRNQLISGQESNIPATYCVCALHRQNRSFSSKAC
jgi:hypothetical protein